MRKNAASLPAALLLACARAPAASPPVASPPAEAREPADDGTPTEAPGPGESSWCAFQQASDLETIQVEGCISKTGPWEFWIAPAVRETMHFDDATGVAGFYFEGHTGYVSKDGKVVVTLTHDNGPDYFAEGLARIVDASGKVGFVDSELDVVIEPRFDFAWPFEGGRAVFCEGCREHADGEHTALVGGMWGFIDRTGAVVVAPVPYDDFKSNRR